MINKNPDYLWVLRSAVFYPVFSGIFGIRTFQTYPTQWYLFLNISIDDILIIYPNKYNIETFTYKLNNIKPKSTKKSTVEMMTATISQTPRQNKRCSNRLSQPLKLQIWLYHKIFLQTPIPRSIQIPRHKYPLTPNSSTQIHSYTTPQISINSKL